MAKDFVTIANEKFENWGEKGQAVYDAAGPDTKWNDYIFQTGFQHSHNVAASGRYRQKSVLCIFWFHRTGRYCSLQ